MQNLLSCLISLPHLGQNILITPDLGRRTPYDLVFILPVFVRDARGKRLPACSSCVKVPPGRYPRGNASSRAFIREESPARIYRRP
jgi:hypothetical protein